jgi:hypothetical protein
MDSGGTYDEEGVSIMGAIAWGALALLAFSVWATWKAYGEAGAIAWFAFCIAVYMLACYKSNDIAPKG